jgi:hypothetical protein
MITGSYDFVRRLTMYFSFMMLAVYFAGISITALVGMILRNRGAVSAVCGFILLILDTLCGVIFPEVMFPRIAQSGAFTAITIYSGFGFIRTLIIFPGVFLILQGFWRLIVNPLTRRSKKR